MDLTSGVVHQDTGEATLLTTGDANVLIEWAEQHGEINNRQSEDVAALVPDKDHPDDQPPLPGVAQPSLENTLQVLLKFKRKALRLSELRRQTLCQRNELSDDLCNEAAKKSHLMESQDLLARGADSSPDSWSNLERQLALDRQKYQEAMTQRCIRENNLSRIEDLLLTEQENLMEIVQCSIEILQAIGIMSSDEPSPEAALDLEQISFPLQSPSPRLPVEVVQYFDKVGDLNVMEERVEEATEELSQLQEVRERKQDQDLTFSSEENDQLQRVQHSCDKAKAARHDAWKEVEKAREICRAAGLDPERNLRQHSEHQNDRRSPETWQHTATDAASYADGGMEPPQSPMSQIYSDRAGRGNLQRDAQQIVGEWKVSDPSNNDDPDVTSGPHCGLPGNIRRCKSLPNLQMAPPSELSQAAATGLE